MRTDFFCKKLKIVQVLSVLTVALMGVFLFQKFKKIPAVDCSVNFYFVVSEDLNIEASTEIIKFGGGAGYLVQKGAREYVALNVYLKKIEAESICQRLNLSGNKVEILAFEVGTITMAGVAKNAQRHYAGGLSSLKSCMSVLSQTINLLDKGMPQERARKILQNLARQLAYLSNEYAQYEKFSSISKYFAQQLQMECQDVIYASKLRFLLCDCAVEYLQLIEK